MAGLSKMSGESELRYAIHLSDRDGLPIFAVQEEIEMSET
jgi:hypothetical protein